MMSNQAAQASEHLLRSRDCCSREQPPNNLESNLETNIEKGELH